MNITNTDRRNCHQAFQRNITMIPTGGIRDPIKTNAAFKLALNGRCFCPPGKHYPNCKSLLDHRNLKLVVEIYVERVENRQPDSHFLTKIGVIGDARVRFSVVGCPPNIFFVGRHSLITKLANKGVSVRAYHARMAVTSWRRKTFIFYGHS